MFPLPRPARWIAGAVVVAGLSWFYVVAATEHGRLVNISKARGDQSGYLMDAKNVYDNWHGGRPRIMIGERNRMPVYAAYLALFYSPDISDPEFFEVGKVANIYLSLILLFLIAIVLARELPRLAAINLTLIAMFGYFIFKAGYTQSELLFYFFLFVTFLGCWHLFRTPPGWRLVLLAAITGVLAAVAHLTKAAMPPFIALFLVAFAAQPLPRLFRTPALSADALRHALWQWTAAAVFVVACLAVLWPYLATNKRAFGRYFYNVNSTFYVWYDDWASASVGTRLHGDNHWWPDLPESEMPSAGRYWREHTVGQMAARVAAGFQDMAKVSYTTYNFLSYLLLYSGVLLLVVATRTAVLAAMIRDHPWLTTFFVAYGAAYLVATAFYFPISGTGTARFYLAHLLPFFFVVSRVLTSRRLTDTTWQIGRIGLRLRHFHVAVTCLLGLDIALHVWPRLMSTYGGF